jgi:hypothetical protein
LYSYLIKYSPLVIEIALYFKTMHAVETSASWNKVSAAYNPGMVYAGAMQSYADVADPTKL